VEPLLRVGRKWHDEDVLQLTFELCDGSVRFVNSAYVGLDWLSETAEGLSAFSGQIHGGMYRLEAGTPGPEFADGSVNALFHYKSPTGLFISALVESDYFTFKGNEVAREAKLFMATEPGLINEFVRELRAMHGGNREDATLRCIQLG
jgi:hypothetical protein